MISRDTVERIREAIDIVELIGDYVDLKKAGTNYKGLSPFTNEKTPSFVVSPAKNIFKCFSTSKGGDGLSFIMEVEGYSYPEALRHLAQRYGIEIEEKKMSPQEVEQKTERESLLIVLNYAKDFYKNILNNTTEGKSIAQSYFKERGFSVDTVNDFDLGYAKDEWSNLLDDALKNQYTQEFLEKSGLVLKNDKGRIYDRFRGRVIFPIHNTTGRVIAFGARILTNEKGQPKYINSPETEVYHKSNVLYGIYQAKNEIRNKNNCYLVEGYTDVISLYQAGVKNVVASSGTSLTKEQITLIKRYTNNITVLYDGDSAGIKASLRGIDMILEQGMNVSSVVFPEGEDPDSYVRKIGGEDFTKYLETTKQDFISFKTSLFLKDANDDPVKKAEIVNSIVESIAKIPDAIQRSMFFKKCSSLLGVEERLLISAHNKILLKDRQKQNKFEEEPPFDLQDEEPSVPVEVIDYEYQGMLEMEGEMLRVLLMYGNQELDEGGYLGEYILNEIDDIQFVNKVYSMIINHIKQQFEQGVPFVLSDFTANEDEAIKKSVIDLLATRYEVSEKWESFQIYVKEEIDNLEVVVRRTILRLKLRKVRLLIKNIEKELLKEGADLDKLLMEHIVVKKMEMAIAKSLGNVTF